MLWQRYGVDACLREGSVGVPEETSQLCLAVYQRPAGHALDPHDLGRTHSLASAVVAVG